MIEPNEGGHWGLGQISSSQKGKENQTNQWSTLPNGLRPCDRHDMPMFHQRLMQQAPTLEVEHAPGMIGKRTWLRLCQQWQLTTRGKEDEEEKQTMGQSSVWLLHLIKYFGMPKHREYGLWRWQNSHVFLGARRFLGKAFYTFINYLKKEKKLEIYGPYITERPIKAEPTLSTRTLSIQASTLLPQLHATTARLADSSPSPWPGDSSPSPWPGDSSLASPLRPASPLPLCRGQPPPFLLRHRQPPPFLSVTASLLLSFSGAASLLSAEHAVSAAAQPRLPSSTPPAVPFVQDLHRGTRGATSLGAAVDESSLSSAYPPRRGGTPSPSA